MIIVAQSSGKDASIIFIIRINNWNNKNDNIVATIIINSDHINLRKILIK